METLYQIVDWYAQGGDLLSMFGDLSISLMILEYQTRGSPKADGDPPSMFGYISILFMILEYQTRGPHKI